MDCKRIDGLQQFLVSYHLTHLRQHVNILTASLVERKFDFARIKIHKLRLLNNEEAFVEHNIVLFKITSSLRTSALIYTANYVYPKDLIGSIAPAF